ncbi:phosphoribosyltransferase-like protein [Maridesulfovibrio sp.]|uniref:phosphoribosyltransferase-like protein n=1 Tax=unclassified Maridesulfovibrio TaxID=2794999 RepID=UPI003AFFA1FD
MPNKNDLIESIAETISDYRVDERNAGHFWIPEPNAAHVERWINQFENELRVPILKELDYVLDKTYISKTTFEQKFRDIVDHPKLVQGESRHYWNQTNIIDVQKKGQSQKIILSLIRNEIKSKIDMSYVSDSPFKKNFLYIDDISFSGGRIKEDLCYWISNYAPQESSIDIALLADHSYGKFSSKGKIFDCARENGKNVSLRWGTFDTYEDRKSYSSTCDVLRPTCIPETSEVENYAKNLNAGKYNIHLRPSGYESRNHIFSSEQARHLLEQEFLKKGVSIYNSSPYLKPQQKPLGNIGFVSFGFGSMLVTYRNCPNNCPLVFWAEGDWYPLFPRLMN